MATYHCTTFTSFDRAYQCKEEDDDEEGRQRGTGGRAGNKDKQLRVDILERNRM